MKKQLLVFIFSWFLIFSLFAENQPANSSKNFNLSVIPNIGVSFENHGEYIYSYSGKRLLSYLEYRAEPLVKYGLTAQVDFYNAKITFGSDFGIPAKCGTMYDSDWNLLGVKTTYSIHENHSQQNYDFSTDFGWAFNFGHQSQFCITPKIGILYSLDSFFAKNGYGWYGGESYSKNGEDNSWDSEYARKAIKIYPIELNRKTFSTFLGFDFSFTPVQKLTLTAGTYAAPYTKIKSTDYHHAKPDSGNDFYINELQECSFLRFKETLSIIYNLTDNIQLYFGTFWIFGPVVKGLLYDDDELTTQPSGSDINEIGLRMGLGWHWK